MAAQRVALVAEAQLTMSRIRNISSSALWLWNGHCALPGGSTVRL